MSKNERVKIFNKYSGHCAYCGCEIDIKEMQVDHIQPKRLGGLDDINNYNPACRICNHYKRSTSLENWREYFLAGIIKRLRNIYIFKVAEKYGMVEVKNWDKKFYFEKESKTE